MKKHFLILLLSPPPTPPPLAQSEEACPEGSIDLKCKEQVTDSEEDEPDGQVDDQLDQSDHIFRAVVPCDWITSR